MGQLDVARAPIDALQRAMGEALDEAIDKTGGKVAFAKRAGLNRATLYRLLSGENVSTEVLLRTLRALGRGDLLLDLVTAPPPSPLELRPRAKKRAARSRAPLVAPPPPGTLVSQLALGQAPRGSDGSDG